MVLYVSHWLDSYRSDGSAYLQISLFGISGLPTVVEGDLRVGPVPGGSVLFPPLSSIHSWTGIAQSIVSALAALIGDTDKLKDAKVDV